MKRLYWENGIIVGLIASLSVWLLTGCATPPERRALSLEAAYLFRCVKHLPDRAHYATQIADRRLKEQVAARPAADSKLLAVWNRYVQELQKPIELLPAAYQGDAQLTAAEVRILDAAVAGEPGLLRLNGAGVSPDWQKELQSARGKVEALNLEYNRLVDQARRSGKDGAYGEAIELLLQALGIVPDAPGLCLEMEALFDKLTEATIQRLTAAVQPVLKGVMDRQQVFGTETSSVELAGKIEADLDKVTAAIEAVRQNMIHGPVTNEHCHAKEVEVTVLMDKLDEQADTLRSRGWAEQIRLLAGKEAYWESYLRLVEKFSLADRAQIRRQPALTKTISEAFGGVLVKAATFYIDKANHSFADDLFGVALVYCGMTREMLDYAQDRKIKAAGNIQEVFARLREPRDDATIKLRERLGRRLLVLDFTPAITEEGLLFGEQFRAQCYRKFEGPNDSVWAMSVPQDKSLIGKTEDLRRSLTEQDYLVSGVIREITIEPVETVSSRTLVEVPGLRVSQVANPLFKRKDDELPVIWEQDMYTYEKSTVLKGKRAVVEASVDVEYAGRKQPLIHIAENIAHTNSAFKELVLCGSDTRFTGRVLGGPLRSDREGVLQPNTNMPTDEIVLLSSDKDIRRFILGASLDRIVAATTKVVEQYPVSFLANQALQKQKEGNAREEAELWAECFWYLYHLSTATAAKAPHASWFAEKKALADHLAIWWETRWAEYPAEARAALQKSGFGDWPSLVRKTLAGAAPLPK